MIAALQLLKHPLSALQSRVPRIHDRTYAVRHCQCAALPSEAPVWPLSASLRTACRHRLRRPGAPLLRWPLHLQEPGGRPMLCCRAARSSCSSGRRIPHPSIRACLQGSDPWPNCRRLLTAACSLWVGPCRHSAAATDPAAPDPVTGGAATCWETFPMAALPASSRP